MQWPSIGELVRSLATSQLIAGISRVLHITRDATHVSLIQVDQDPDENLEGPYVVALGDLRAGKANGRVEGGVRYNLPRLADPVAPKYRFKVDYEARWKEFQCLVAASNRERVLFDSSERAKELKKITTVGPRQARRLFYFLLIHDFNPHALAKNYSRCGDKGGVILDPDHVPSESQWIGVGRTVQARKPFLVEQANQKRQQSILLTKGPRGTSKYTLIQSPCERFELDASKNQVRMVASMGSGRIIKPATIYSMIDAFSGIIVFALLSPRPPSMDLALYFLRECFNSKNHLFDRHGLDYTDRDFPCRHVPTTLAVDRGEFTGKQAQVVVGGGVTIEIARSMTPWDKAMVENRFNQIKRKTIMAPGRYRKHISRREDDGTDDACITYELGNRLLWQAIYELNQLPVALENIPAGYPVSKNADISHNAIFRWGLTNRYASVRTLNPDDVLDMFSLKDHAVVLDDALSFRGDLFKHPRIHDPSVPIFAEPGGPKKTQIIYDDAIPERIRFKYEDRWTIATSRSRAVINARATIYDVEAFLQDARAATKATALQAADDVVRNRASNAPILKKALKKAKDGRASTKRQPGTLKDRVHMHTDEELERQKDLRLAAETLAEEEAEAARPQSPVPFPTPTPTAAEASVSLQKESTAAIARRLLKERKK